MIVIIVFPLFLETSELRVSTLNDENDLPEKFCSSWKRGDILVSDSKHLVIIGSTSRPLLDSSNYPIADALGNIISFVPSGNNTNNDLIIGEPYIRLEGKRKHASYISVKPMNRKTPDEPLTILATALFKENKGQKAQIQTIYTFFTQQGRIDITSAVKNTGKISLEELSYSLYFNAKHDYSFSPFHRKKHPELRFRTVPRKGHSLAWISLNPPPEEGQLLPGKLAPGESYEVRNTLLVGTQTSNLLQDIYQILGIIPERSVFHFKHSAEELLEIIVRDISSSSVYFRSFLKNPFSLEVPLPQGLYRVRANFFPAVQEELLLVQPEKKNECILEDLPTEKVRVKITNSQKEYVPGKVTFIGLDPTPSPYFMPENPMESGRDWEPFKNSCYPIEKGTEVELPGGTYLIYASRGPHYTIDQKAVEILKGNQQELAFVIDKVIETDHLISVDTHMHTHFSDGEVKIAERIKSVIAEGVDIAIASDHNYITDYGPTLNKLGLENYLSVMSGKEVTARGLIHYNTYPLAHKDEEAIELLKKDVPSLFKATRSKYPEAIVQVNHPRDGSLGYFNNFQLDQDTAETALENFDTSFDVLEVVNGPYFYSNNFVAISDWLNLLNRGYYFPIAGSSDAHGIAKSEPGYFRTYVYYEGERGQGLNEIALINAIKKGHSFVSNGPLVELKIEDKYIPGDSLKVSQGTLNVQIKVQSAPWISVDEVRLIINGERKIVFNVKEERSLLKLKEEIGLTLKKDSYIALEALGKKSLFPVLQANSWSGLLWDTPLPYALTNPIFVDVDGNGKFDPITPGKIKTISKDKAFQPFSRQQNR